MLLLLHSAKAPQSEFVLNLVQVLFAQPYAGSDPELIGSTEVVLVDGRSRYVTEPLSTFTKE
jgi:hypothetical protein